MLKQKNFPRVFIYDGVTYTDLSFKMLSFGRDYFQGSILTTDFIYFGRFKQFSSFYVEMGSTVNAVSANLNIEYWNGTTWVSVSYPIDDTICFSRSGFVEFESPSDWAANTINGVENYYLRLTVSVNTTANIRIQGMNVVFSDDQDLKGVYPTVTNYLQSGELSFILRHENSRDLIVQDIRNIAIKKRSVSATYYENIDAWDLLEIDEVNMWATYLTLENIFSGLQSNGGDFYKDKSEEYAKKAEFYKNATYLTLDKDNDGIKDSSERSSDISVRRLVRR
jgi:hypothetical protein